MAKRKRHQTGLTVQTLPLLRDDILALGQGLVDPAELPEMDLWWVTPPMCDLAHAAAPSLPNDQPLSSYAPSVMGLLLWEAGTGHTTPTSRHPNAAPAEIRGMLWQVIQGQLVLLPLVHAPLARFALTLGLPITSPTAPAAKMLATSWLLASQESLTRTHQVTSDLTRTRMRGLNLPRTVTVATLRERPHHAQKPTGGDTGEQWFSTRFLVRGHWRQQACGPARSQRRPTWVVPYIKGPEDAPFRQTDLVKVWRR